MISKNRYALQIERVLGFQCHDGATVANVSVDLVVPTWRFGSVHGGLLILESRIHPVADYVRLRLGYQIVDNRSDEYSADTVERIEFFPDTDDDGATIEAVFTGIELE
ncbi:hypothetical protein FHL15_002918 [Xylaria flabelliformis]|uniref:Uncharacterized protein n=1 Tax=Xylaria flabelliformis TaxID=2512241 RepID=A0A553I7P2_9PEZI|nr:hypothetical protein FHL15_002918 [Xylaria flabelliformis]